MKRLKSIFLALALFVTISPSSAQSSIGGRFGFSEFDGFLTVSYKTEFNGSALELNGGFDLGINWVTVMADYYFFEKDIDLVEDGTLQWYTGAGGQLWVGDGIVIGPDGKLGLEYKFEDTPIEIFTDVAAFLGVSSGRNRSNRIDLGFQYGLGLRVPF